MRFDIRSNEGVGPVSFGMKRNEVRAQLGAEFESFKRSRSAAQLADHFIDLGCFIYYDDENGVVEAVEFYEPAQPTLNGSNLLGLQFLGLVALIRDLDPEIAIDKDGFTSLRLGVGGYAPNHDECELPCEAIIVFVRGYYD